MRTSHHVLVADAGAAVCDQISRALSADGLTVSQARDGRQALEMLADHVYQLVITDLDLPRGGGMEILEYLREHSPATPVIITAAGAALDSAVEAMRAGAFDIREKPLNTELLRLTAQRALEQASLHHAYHYLRHEQPYLYRLERITAESPGMKQVLEQVSRLAPTNITVLLTGETGTGKSLVAGAIHANSPRREGTLVTVNCAALSETLLESELFGHEKGAFTGAHKSRAGRFQQAHGGTIFLDEVGEMSPAIQAKVLRVLEEQKIYRVGGSREIHVDVRILAATNRDLAQEVDDGVFRQDLYYRINVAPVHIPPLRERREDILPLADRFMRRICAEMNRPVMSMAPDAQAALLAYAWPGNIRELRNLMERTALFADGEVIKSPTLNLSGTASAMAASPPAATGVPGPDGSVMLVSHTLDLQALERQAMEVALEKSEWVQKQAASLLGISERSMTYRLNKLGIHHPGFRTKSRR